MLASSIVKARAAMAAGDAAAMNAGATAAATYALNVGMTSACHARRELADDDGEFGQRHSATAVVSASLHFLKVCTACIYVRYRDGMTSTSNGAPVASGPEAGRRDRKKAETRDALQWAALRLAGEHGVDRVTVEAITDAADVSVRTFFNYFASKEDAILGTDDARPEARLPLLLAERPPGEALVPAFRAVLAEIADSFADTDPLWQARRDLLRTNPSLLPKVLVHFAEFEKSLADAVARRIRAADTDLYPAVVAAAVVSAVRVAMTHWRASPAEASLPRLLTEAFDVLAAGLESTAPMPTGETR
ncbi:MAG: Transcriptional regulator, TetR family [Frankiales bacterium]|nr:Transcriptional regulator, TetR family [Frankiales bacterium]